MGQTSKCMTFGESSRLTAFRIRQNNADSTQYSKRSHVCLVDIGEAIGGPIEVMLVAKEPGAMNETKTTFRNDVPRMKDDDVPDGRMCLDIQRIDRARGAHYDLGCDGVNVDGRNDRGGKLSFCLNFGGDSSFDCGFDPGVK